MDFIYTPLIILGLAALITVGTISPTNPTQSILTPQNEKGSCNVPTSFTGILALIFFNPLAIPGTLGCYVVQGTTNLIFNVPQIQQYGVPVSGSNTTATSTTITTCSTSTVSYLLTGAFVIISCGLGFSNTTPQQSSTLLTSSNIQEGFLIVILTIVAVAVITGINVIGTGLSSASVYIIFTVMGFTILWLIESSLAMPLFFGIDQSIPPPFGAIAYLIISAMFTAGILRKV